MRQGPKVLLFFENTQLLEPDEKIKVYNYQLVCRTLSLSCWVNAGLMLG